MNVLIISILLYGYDNAGHQGCTVCMLNTTNIIGTYFRGGRSLQLQYLVTLI